MNSEQLIRFKELLSVPSKTYLEDMMVSYIETVLSDMDGVTFWKDEHKNLYATKGVLNEGEYYPMFIAHTDTVHDLVDEINVLEGQSSLPPTFGKTYPSDEIHDILYAVDQNNNPTGIGGDDKCGIFLCLELLRALDKVKIGLFVSEETGCHGSSKCDVDFLSDVGYIVQYDAPGGHLITEVCSGVRLFEKDGDFINRIQPVIEICMGDKMLLQSHPYTDVSQLKMKSDVSCINISCGYYHMHTPKEFISIQDVVNAFNAGLGIVNELGYDRSEYVYEKPNYGGFYPWNSDDEGEDEYQGNEEYESDGIKIREEGEGIVIENLFSGEEVFLFNEDCIDLYEYLRNRLMKKYAY
jgi:hypothetical protein